MRTFYFDTDNSFYVYNNDLEEWESIDFLSTLKHSIANELKIYHRDFNGLELHYGRLLFTFKESFRTHVAVIEGGDEFMDINEILDKLEENPNAKFLQELALAWIDLYNANCDTTEIEERYYNITN